MPYLPTSQAYLEQSAQLLQAYPETTRITTKYNFPTTRPGNAKRIQKSQAKKNSKDNATTQATTTPAAPIASLTLKTFNPGTGICLQYRTNKAQEVSRLITSLGKLAAGADVAGLGLGNAAPVGDVEMVDAPAAVAAPVEEAGAGKGQAQGQSQAGGKGKKKGGKGKR
ncbi:hypothetical protein PENARI_c001G01167 [Penicillium arizonense]|uniref:SRP9 domain-containing protein n=1 Tax=Penicillium arizonense TaxID=1835702 RepID=A0A1F5LX89_PENAI|nr:hypothetical protein PENARI_c001G01167 [Penicillium arizonense]KAJ6079005.1 hypothetical protein N7467_008758 [Penicillium canescens]OGE57788.1 hypothetical protein PENARI_c001G01167 [Penicillium arizonense]